MKLRPCIKKYKKDTHRAVSPEETLPRIDSKMVTAGITQVVDITNLDRVGIPVFSSIRPTADKGGVSIYNGKGATPVGAKVSAMMEGIERYSAEVHDRDLTVSSFPVLREKTNALNPKDLILPPGSDPNATIPWIEGYDLMNEEEIFVPASAVFHPLPKSHHQLFGTNTNGLASGNVMEEAIFHGLSEVIERDAWSLTEVARDARPTITNIRDDLADNLLKKFSDAMVEVQVKDITSDILVPTIVAVADGIKLGDPALLTIGMGTHTSANVAVLRALTEAAQSRLSLIHVAREDTVAGELRRRVSYDHVRLMNWHWFQESEFEEFSQIESHDSDDFLDDIRFMMNRLKAADMNRVIVVDLTREEIGVPVVRVVVPGLEVYAVNPERIGQRCRAEAKNRRLSRSKPRWGVGAGD